MIDPKGSKVVYWVGAGASFQSLPIVSEMPAAFRDQGDQLEHGFTLPLKKELSDNGLKRYRAYLEKMARWSKQFGSIDTYARALFLLGKKRERELAELKLHIALYFLLAQVLPREWHHPVLEYKRHFQKPERVDTRYMALLALLMNEHGGLSDRVNIISWNYDLQLEYAMMWFREHESMNAIHTDPNIRIFPSLFGTNSTYAVPPSIIRLNGVAGHARLKGEVKALYADVKNPRKGVGPFIEALFDDYKDVANEGSEMLTSMVDTLNFAWEPNETSRMAIELSKRVMQEAETLVIIGYSFPSFNRKVDRELFNAFANRHGRSRRVVLQNGSQSPDTFTKMMGIDQRGDPNPLTVECEENLAQFHVPPTFF